MTSPLLDEAIMLQALQDTPGHTELRENTRRLQAGATMLLVDAFDRRVTRENFISVVAAAMGLADALGHYDMMAAMKLFQEDGTPITQEDVEITLQQALGKVQSYTSRCAEMGSLMAQCPNDEDRVQ